MHGVTIINSMAVRVQYGINSTSNSNGKDTNCTRRSRVLLTLPVLVVLSAINPFSTSNHTIDTMRCH